MARQRNGEPNGRRRARSRVTLAATLVTIGYVALVGARHGGPVDGASVALAALALALGWLSARSRSRPLVWALWGAGLVAASLVGATDSTAIAAAAGALVAAVAGMVALPRVRSLGGILDHRSRTPWRGVVMLGVLWAPAAIATVAARAPRLLALEPWVLVAAASTSVVVVTAMAAAARLERRLELGVVERLDASLACAGAAALGGACAAFGGFEPRAAACATLAATGVAVAAAAELGDPVALWEHVRRAGAALAVATVLTLVFWFLVENDSSRARATAAVLLLAAVLAGAELSRLRRAASGGDRRLTAIAAARDALRGKDAEAALEGALHALRAASPAAREAPRPEQGRPPSPELWTLDPVRCLRADAAGYAHDEPGALPPELLVLACGEPEATLRVEVLDAVEVRRPDLRALARWMHDARLATATMIAREGELEGVLFLPEHPDAGDLRLEEARALHALASDLAPLCHARAQLARSMERERAARQLADETSTRAERLEHQLARAAAHHALAATRLARPAAVGIYSARSRGAYDALEKLAKAQAPAVVVARSGVDPVPYLARAHLAGARAHAPLVLVDCTSAREHDLGRWRDPVASPLALADGGVLVLLDAAALPADVQRLVGQALAERRAPWERPDALDVALTLTTVDEPAALAESGRLDPVLTSRAGAALTEPVRLPGIDERPEDIRALVTDRLAREGLRARGEPVGIEDAAFARLVDHPFEGEDAELATIVQKLVARARGPVVREEDVEAVLAEPAHRTDADRLVAGTAGVISPKPIRRRL